MDDRLGRQVQFILEIDKLKRILRQTPHMEGERWENSAEHSWHMGIMVSLLAEYADEPVDELRVLKMVLVHDVIEVDAGDTYCYDLQAMQDKAQREQRAAERLFGMLPFDQATEFRSLWDEFEERKTPESRFANALDRVQPVLINFHTDGRSWKAHGVTRSQVLQRNQTIEEGSRRLWGYISGLIEEGVRRGYILED